MNSRTMPPISPGLDQALDLGFLVFRPDGELEHANARAREVLGCPTDEILGAYLRRLGIKPGPGTETPIRIQAMALGSAGSLELHLSRLTSEAPGTVVGLVTTADMRREADLRLAAHLRVLSRAEGATLHDLRTPLHTMVLYLELLRGALADREADADPKRERYLQVITSEIQRLERMLEVVMGQIQLGRKAPGAFDLRSVLEDLLAFLHPVCYRKRVAVEIRVPEEAVLIDLERDVVRHSLLQLLASSIEDVPGESSLEVAVSVRDRTACVRFTGTSTEPSCVHDPIALRPTPGPDERDLDLAVRSLEREGGRVVARPPEPGTVQYIIELPLVAERH
jgi:signal transduction histidine kinase